MFLRQFAAIVLDVRWRLFGLTLSLFLVEGAMLVVVYEIPLVII